MKMILFKTALLLALLACSAGLCRAEGTNTAVAVDITLHGPGVSPDKDGDGGIPLTPENPGGDGSDDDGDGDGSSAGGSAGSSTGGAAGSSTGGGGQGAPGAGGGSDASNIANGGSNAKPKKPKEGNNEDGTTVNDPIRVADGAVVFSETDIVIPCPLIDLVFMRRYDSNLLGGENIGFRWVHSYDWVVVRYKEPDGEFGDWLALRALVDPNNGGEGSIHWFKKQTNGFYTVSSAGTHILTINESDEYNVTTQGGLIYHFDSSGILKNIIHPAGQQVDLSYDAGKLVRVEHSNGKYLQFTYNAASQIAQVTTPSTNMSVSFKYDVGEGVPSYSTIRPLLLKTTRRTPRGDFALTYSYGEAVQ